MTLDLNDIVIPYQEYYGSNNQQMQRLIADGRIPISVSQVMERRLNSRKQNWKDNYFGTGDAIVYHPDGKFKVVLDSQKLREITSESKLNNGALVLADGMYEQFQGEEFKRENAIFERELTAKEVKAHAVWRCFARNQELLNEYTNKMFLEMKTRFTYDNNMGIYLASPQKMPTLRAAWVGGLGDGSGIDGRVVLGSDIGRFVGVAPEALSASNKTESGLEMRSK